MIKEHGLTCHYCSKKFDSIKSKWKIEHMMGHGSNFVENMEAHTDIEYPEGYHTFYNMQNAIELLRISCQRCNMKKCGAFNDCGICMKNGKNIHQKDWSESKRCLLQMTIKIKSEIKSVFCQFFLTVIFIFHQKKRSFLTTKLFPTNLDTIHHQKNKNLFPNQS